MFKKLITPLLFVAGLLTSLPSQAQDFTFLYKPMVDTTTDGSAPFSMYNYVINQTDNTIQISWRLNKSISELPTGWAVSDICDNFNCYATGLETYRTFSVAPHDTAELKPDIFAASVGTGIVRVEVNTANQTDTAIYILTRIQGTGINETQQGDNRLSIYPNPLPAGQNLNLFVDKSLKAKDAVVYNIIGQKQLVLTMNNGKELNSFNVSQLPAGMYVLKLNNAQGKIIASRKFTKQ